MNKCICFEVEGELGLFKIPNASSTKLTYQIIPRTAINGLIAAIIGKINDELDFTIRNNYLQFFTLEESFISVELLKPIKKINMGVNFRNIKKFHNIGKMDFEGKYLFEEVAYNYDQKSSNDALNKYSPTAVEFLKRPKYRIYFYHRNPLIYNTLKHRLENEETYFPIYLGNTDGPAIIKNYKEINIKEYEVKEGSKELNIVSLYNQNNNFDKLLVKIDSSVYKRHSYFSLKFEDYLDEEIISFDDYIVEKQAMDFYMKGGNKLVKKYEEIVSSLSGVYCFVDRFYRTELNTNIIFYR